MDLHVLADAVVQLDGDVAGVLHDRVRHVREVHGLAVEVLAADAEEHLGVHKYLQRISDGEWNFAQNGEILLASHFK